MKKKTLLIIFTVILAVTIIGAPFLYVHHQREGWPWDYWGWQTIYVDKIGEFKIPSEWQFKQNENIIIITDESGDHIYAIGGVNLGVNGLIEIVEEVTSSEGIQKKNLL